VNLLVVGVSHHTAPVDLLERVALRSGETASFLAQLMALTNVNEAVVLSTTTGGDLCRASRHSMVD
jgi:glutamyl-tRNA reductase